VWDKETEGDNATVPTPTIGYATLFAFAMQVLCGGVDWEKFMGSKVIWFVAPESIIHALASWELELQKTWRQLPGFIEVEELVTGQSESWDSTVTTTALPVPSSSVVVSFFFLACNSCHYFGYPCSLKQVSRLCLTFPQRVHFPPSDGPFDFKTELCFPATSVGNWPNFEPLVAIIASLVVLSTPYAIII